MNVSLHGSDHHHQHVLSGRILQKQRFQYFYGLFHRLGAADQLRQKILALIKQFAHFIDGRKQTGIQDHSGFLSCIQGRLGNGLDTAPISLQNGVIQLLKRLRKSAFDIGSPGRNRCFLTVSVDSRNPIPLLKELLSLLLCLGLPSGSYFIHALNISNISIFLCQQKIRSQSAAYQQFLGGIGDGHRQSLADSQREESGIHKYTLRHSKGDVGQSADGSQSILFAEANGFQSLYGSPPVGSYSGNQPVYYDILRSQPDLISSLQHGLNNIDLLLQVFRQSLVRQRQQNKHSAVFFGYGQQLLILLLLKGNRVDQRSARIASKCSLQYFHMAGIQGERQIGDTAYLLNGAQHHLLFINTAHSHIDVKNCGTCSLLLLRKLKHHIHFTLAQLLLQLLFAGRIDSLSHDEKSSVQSKGYRTSLRCQIVNVRVSSPEGGNLLFSVTAVQSPDKIGRGAAAAPQYGGAGICQHLHLGDKFFRIHAVTGFPVSIQEGKSCIGFGDHRNVPGHRDHIANDLFHMGRTCRTIDSQGTDP